MVVLVHGGPWVRSSLGLECAKASSSPRAAMSCWNRNYRGSTGYGQQHFKAGWKQWGLKMQDDIADGARWAIAAGHCRSATHLHRRRQLWRLCGADGPGQRSGPVPLRHRLAGVTDIDLLRDGQLGRLLGHFARTTRKYGMPMLVGDPRQGCGPVQGHLAAAAGRAHHASRCCWPTAAPTSACRCRMAASFTRPSAKPIRRWNGSNTPHEGHGWALPKTAIDFWRRVEKFLQRHIGTPGTSTN